MTLDEYQARVEAEEEERNKPRVHIARSVVDALMQRRVVFIKNQIELPKEVEPEKDDEAPPTAPAASLADKETVRKMLEDRDKRLAHNVDVDEHLVPLELYKRPDLPPYVQQQGKDLLLMRSLIQVPDLLRLGDSGVSLAGKSDQTVKLWRMMEADQFSSSAEFASRAELVPSYVETPLLYALLQRPTNETDRWLVPAVINTIELMRYYRALVRMLRYMFFKNNREFYHKTVESYFSMVEEYNLQIQELRTRSRERVALRLREANAPVDSLHISDPADLLGVLQKHRDILIEYERATRQCMIDHIQSFEALLAQLLGIGAQFCEGLYSSGRIPPVALIPTPDKLFNVPQSALDFWLLCIKIKNAPLEGVDKGSPLTLANAQLSAYLESVTKPVHHFLYAMAGDAGGALDRVGMLSIDGLVGRFWYWVSAVYWTAHYRLIPRGTIAKPSAPATPAAAEPAKK